MRVGEREGHASTGVDTTVKLNRALPQASIVALVALVACGDSTVSDDDDDDGSGSAATTSGPSGTGGANTTNTSATGVGGAGEGGNGSGAEGAAGTGGATDNRPAVNVTATGDCSPDFSGTLSVATNTDSLAVYSQNGGTGDSSIQVALQGATGVQTLSTQHRVDTGIVINLIDDGATWTNIASFQPDPITGTMEIVTNEQSDGRVELVFTSVTLALTGTQPSLCTINGSVETFGEYFGQ